MTFMEQEVQKAVTFSQAEAYFKMQFEYSTATQKFIHESALAHAEH